MTHFVMESDDPPAAARIVEAPVAAPQRWRQGAVIPARPEQPLEFGLDPSHPGALKPLYDETVPIMSRELAEALEGAGVDNIELFDAAVHEPWSGRRIEGCRAFNIVGLVEATDMAASTLMMETGQENPLEADFERLVFDRPRLPSHLMVFRLAVAGRPIVVHARVRQALEAAGIEGLRFFGDGEWSG